MCGDTADREAQIFAPGAILCLTTTACLSSCAFTWAHRTQRWAHWRAWADDRGVPGRGGELHRALTERGRRRCDQ